MKKILLVDYYGTCSADGKMIGHSCKVLREYKELIEKEYMVGAALSPCLVREVISDPTSKYEQLIPLKYNIIADDFASIFKRIKDKIKIFYNIHQSFKVHDYDIIWFYRTDFFLLLYFFLFGSGRKNNKRKCKIVVLIYQNSFGQGRLGRFLNYFYYGGLKKVDGIISTQKGLKKLGVPSMRIPDYYYDVQKYEKYKTNFKMDKAVCVGTMTPYKQLRPLVEAFNKNGMLLEIRGFFYDKEQYNKLMQCKKDNILIEDVILEENEYYKAIAEAKYSILPYDMDQYDCRTSGVLQESLFLNTVPVAPTKLLEENGIEGLGYQLIEELETVDFFDESKFNARKSELQLKEYDKELVKERISNFFMQLT